MLDKQNIVIESLAQTASNNSLVEILAHEAYVKMVDYLRLTQAKNTLNRFSDYHYLTIPVANSTEPIRGVDYIHPVVAPGIDYATAIITKCLMPNGKVSFEFVKSHEGDVGARQATEMALHMINSKNDSYALVRDWAQDGLLHKNGIVMVMPRREPVVQYKEVEGTRDQLRSFEILAADKGLVAKRQQMRRIDVNLQGVAEEMMQPDEAEVNQEMQGEEVQEAIRNNTVYRAKYKLTGYSTTVRFKHIQQHYFVANPTIPRMQDQDFVGFYDPMTIHEAKEQYPFIDLEKFADHAAYGPAGAYQAGALENDLALHARDSTPVPGQGVVASQGADRYSRVVMITTAWIRRDIDNDGEEELVEVCYSGSYILYMKEVEFIPLANMCPKPIVSNFFGYSLAERLVPMQEYATSIARAEMTFAMQSSTARIGVNPEFVDAEEIQRGVSAMFVLDRKFDATKHVYEFQPMQGNLGYVQSSMERFEADKNAMIGMTTPGDMLNPEVMKDGNSGYKLQLALGPNQLIQDEMVKNCAMGLKDLIYLTWRTMVLYADDYNIQQLAGVYGKGQGFMDAKSMENFEFIDRKDIDIDLALGFLSDENRLTRQQLILQTQQGFAQAMMQLDPSMPEMFFKLRKSFEDTLYVLGVKDCDAYLPTMEEAMKMFQAKQAAGPNIQEQEIQSKVGLNQAKTQESQTVAALNIKKAEDIDMDNFFEMQAMKKGKLSAVEID